MGIFTVIIIWLALCAVTLIAEKLRAIADFFTFKFTNTKYFVRHI